MKRFVCLLLVGWGAWQGALARAQEAAAPPPTPPPVLPPAAPAPASCPAVCTPLVEKTLSSYKLFLQDHECATTIPRMVEREYEVCRELRPGLELDWSEQRFTCCEIRFERREVEQEVVCMEVRPETTVDPATGKPCTVYKACPVVKKVTVACFQPVQDKKEYIVRYPLLKPTEKEVLVKKLAVDHYSVPGIERTLSVIPAPCEAKVLVPTTPPLPCMSN